MFGELHRLRRAVESLADLQRASLNIAPLEDDSEAEYNFNDLVESWRIDHAEDALRKKRKRPETIDEDEEEDGDDLENVDV